MTDILENKEMTEINEGEMNFEEMLEESLKSFTTDEKVHGVVVGIARMRFMWMSAESKLDLFPSLSFPRIPMLKQRTL